MALKGQILTAVAGENLADLVVMELEKHLAQDDPLALTEVTLFVPSPRAGLALKEAFLRRKNAGLLPEIHMMSFHDEDMDAHRFERQDLGKQDIISPLGRQMILSQLIQLAFPTFSFSKSFEQAVALSSLFSKLKAYDLTLADIENEIPENLSHHWQENVEFFKIAFEFYPIWLAEHHKVDAVDAAQKAVAVKLDSLKEKGMPHLTWAVGFSDTTPLGLKLIREIIQHEKGALILSSLDKEMPEDAFQNLLETHPQYTMKRMLNSLGVDRQNVQMLGTSELSARNLCWNQALAPADRLKKLDENIALKSILGATCIEAQTETEEAEIVALIMRETLEEKGKTCALISPDRNLSLRVESTLKKWGVNVDDSAGVPLLSTPLGQLFFMVLNVVKDYFPPLLMAELLHHPLVSLSTCEHKEQKIKALEHLVLRGEKPSGGFAGLRRKLKKSLEDPYKDESMAPDALAMVDFLEEIFTPLQGQSSTHSVDFWLKKHMDILMRLLRVSEDDGFDIFDEESGQTLLSMLASWQDASVDVQKINFETYMHMLESVMSTTAVRKRQSTHPRLFIWGPMESRMQHVDRVIVGGFNEGVWPREGSADPWFNSAICQKLGLPNNAIHVGMSAHDLLNLVTRKEVFITRTLKDGNGETIPSRFFSRLKSVMPKDTFTQMLNKGDVWKQRMKKLRLKGEIHRQKPPSVAPKVERRPPVWSASTVRNIMQCPYKLYIQKVLRLEAFEPFEEGFTASSRGQLIHKILESFFMAVPNMPPPYTGNKIDEKAMFKHMMKQAIVAFETVEEKASKALGLRQFKKIAKVFAAKVAQDEQNDRSNQFIEKEAKVMLDSGVQLYAKADRIDVSKNGMVVIDYKTGAPPKIEDVLNGIEPQMATEAVIMKKGGFGGNKQIDELQYWHVSGTGHEPLKIQNALGKKEDVNRFTEQAEQALNNISLKMHKQEYPYEAFPGGEAMEKKKGPCTFCDYAGICRFKDWVSHEQH